MPELHRSTLLPEMTLFQDNMHTSMNSAHISDSATSIHFNRKLLFSANQKFISSRGHRLSRLNTTASQTDLWNIKPPDFTPKLYRSLSLPQIKKKTLDPAIPRESLRQTSLFLLPNLEKKMTEPSFIRSYKAPDLLESQLLFVKSGQYPNLPYKNPKPHNFRPCADNMPDMVTTIEKDPGNLKFKSQYLESKIVEPSLCQREELRKIDTFKPAELKWDSKLILPKSPWPPKSASYTRHRRRRGVYSAFMDRVEEKLTRSWMKE
ncbi:uncharacterized protein si:dkey-30e9.6 [Astyanax mexicanus]|uniref:uncharacterized protein si:dkey-30e9.6 n=1 Tax=Astyanax mexicanus TaxID=7994 RepID=UPI000BBD5D58|nr:uncharacterized protein si:dkey-30e9.6 [Astyanax mexicanus]